jgi:hypothetical protein
MVTVFVPPLLVNPRPSSGASAAPCTIFVSPISPTMWPVNHLVHASYRREYV